MATPNAEETMNEIVNHDDLCPICHLLFYRPVTTQCGHTLCESCMAHWAEVSVTERFQIVPLNDENTPAAHDQIEVKCPMCRTITTSLPNVDREDALRTRYPLTYQARREEEDADGDLAEEVFTMAVYVGNTHQYKPSGHETSKQGNTHEWTFFVRPERSDIIHEVRILLVCSPQSFCNLGLCLQHPTFHPPQVVRRHWPYEITRLGWGTFQITAQIVLRHEYQWMSSDAETLLGSNQSLLPIEWMLSFDGEGEQGKARLKVRIERKARMRMNAE
jgi:YEATS family/zinc finger of C3HC4-type, RING